jgi:hypothetical protein
MTTDASRTHHASQAVALSELVALKFAKLSLGGKTPRTLKVSSTDGLSTAGGRKARQSLVLTTIDGKKGPAIVCGFMDTARGVAELRSFVVLDKQNRDRFGEPLDFMRVDYDKFVHDMVSFLTSQGLDARISNEKIERSQGPEAQAAPKSGRSSDLVVMLVFGFVLGLATGYVIFDLM